MSLFGPRVDTLSLLHGVPRASTAASYCGDLPAAPGLRQSPRRSPRGTRSLAVGETYGQRAARNSTPQGSNIPPPPFPRVSPVANDLRPLRGRQAASTLPGPARRPEGSCIGQKGHNLSNGGRPFPGRIALGRRRILYSGWGSVYLSTASLISILFLISTRHSPVPSSGLDGTTIPTLSPASGPALCNRSLRPDRLVLSCITERCEIE